MPLGPYAVVGRIYDGCTALDGLLTPYLVISHSFSDLSLIINGGGGQPCSLSHL